jgi:uncharacterized membrane-anchored protein YhcB (DUF1043 family)
MVMLDGQLSLWVIGILGILIGTVLGCMITYSLMTRNGRTRQLQLELNQLKENFQDYRDQVTQHFMRSSELVQEMTNSYRSVYEHLASGAHHLCGDIGATPLGHQASARLDDANDNGLQEPEVDYDEYEELSRIRDDLDELLGEAPRISDIKASSDTDDKSLQH